MSQSLLYHTFKVRGYRLVKTEFDGGFTLLHVVPGKSLVCCPECRSKNVVHRGSMHRWLRNLPVGDRCTWLIVKIPRVDCKDCGIRRQINLSIADPKRTYTRAFARYVLELCSHMTIKDVADHLCVSWDIVKDIQKRHLQKHFSKPRLKDVRQIAIDEICIGKGHRYLTLVLDLQSGAVLYVGDGKGAHSLEDFWKRLRPWKNQIEAVAMDMSRAYVAAAQDNLPKAKIVFYRFHVVKLMNEKLADLRRELHREVTDVFAKKALKGTRWLLLKRPENLDANHNEKARLEEALALNQPLATAYYLKEELNEFWKQDNLAQARSFIQGWINDCRSSGLRQLITMADTISSHLWGLLNWYNYPISTGPMEGTNNKIKTMQRQHYGLRDLEFRKLKIYALHTTRYALVG